MFVLLVIVHVLVALFLILVILLQSGKAGDLASAFGGAGSQTAFGARGAATVLTKATAVCAVIFMLTSLALAIMFHRTSGVSVLERVPYSEPAPLDEAAPRPTEPSAAPGAQESPQEGQAEPQSGEPNQ